MQDRDSGVPGFPLLWSFQTIHSKGVHEPIQTAELLYLSQSFRALALKGME